MSEKIKMTVVMDVTVPQALALQAMFKYYNYLGGIGASRKVGFFADGDGNFQPNCSFVFSEEMPELTDELSDIAVINGKESGEYCFDFDPIAWELRKIREEKQ